MSDSVHILIGAVVVLCGGLLIYSVTKPIDRSRMRAEPETHQVFEWLDQACQRRFGANYTVRTNRCCQADADVCATM
jgi:hypothetical protein